MGEHDKASVPIILEKPWFHKGYNSHGQWTTFGDICETERERGNYPFVDYKDKEVERYKDIPAIWVCTNNFTAFTYHLGASEVERPIEELQEEYPDWEAEVTIVDCEDLMVIPESDDGDEGFVVLNMKAEKGE